MIDGPLDQRTEVQATQAPPSTPEVEPNRRASEATESKRQPASPWKRLPRNILQDQKVIWSSPFHTSRQDAKWWLILGSATGGLIATDQWTAKQLPNGRDQIAVSRRISLLGAPYTLLPLTGALYFAGAASKNERLHEAGTLGSEALVDSLLVVSALKMVTRRQRPLEGDGSGQFWQGGGRIWDAGSSFPSGHAAGSWALAAVIAHQYPRPRTVPVLSYGLATAVIASRFSARRHFASDALAGAAIGWFIGDYVYGKRHNLARDPQRSRLRKVLAHVHLGPGM